MPPEEEFDLDAYLDQESFGRRVPEDAEKPTAFSRATRRPVDPSTLPPTGLEPQPRPPSFIEELGSAAVSNAPAFLAGPTPGAAAAFAGGVGLDLLMNRAAPPSASDLRAQAAGGAAETLFGLTPMGRRLRQANRGLDFLGRIGAQTGAVGLEQAFEAAQGDTSAFDALSRTFSFGLFPATAGEAFRRAAVRAVGRQADPELVEALNVHDPRELQVMGLSAFSDRFQNVNNFVNELSLVNHKTHRDRRLLASAFNVLAEEGLAPDVAVSRFTSEAGERGIPNIQATLRRALFQEQVFNDLVRQDTGRIGREPVERLPEAGDVLVRNPDGTFDALASKSAKKAVRENSLQMPGSFVLTPSQIRVAQEFVQSDPGEMAKLFARDNTKIDSVIVPLMSVLRPEDRSRLVNAYVAETILGPALRDSIKGVDPSEVVSSLRGQPTSLTRNKANELMVIDPTILKKNLSANNQKLAAVLGEGTDLKMGRERLNRLNSLANVLEKNKVRLDDVERLSQNEVYISNRLIFRALGGGGLATALGVLPEVAIAGGAAIGLGSAVSLALNSPKAFRLFLNAAEGNSMSAARLIRNLQGAGWQLIPGRDGISELVEPPQAPGDEPEPPQRQPGTLDFLSP